MSDRWSYGGVPASSSATARVRCLDCRGDYIAFTDDGGYCLQCRGHVFVYLDLGFDTPTPSD